MRIPRLFQDTDLSVGDNIVLDAQATVHVTRVLRLKPGDAVIVFNGRGGEYQGRIVSQEKRSACVFLEEFIKREVESPLNITLAQGISRGERMDYTVQKAVELGVSRIVPLLTERTGVNLQGNRKQRRREHWQAIISSACEQSGRNRLPELGGVELLPNFLARCAESGPAMRLVLHHRTQQTLAQLPMQNHEAVLLVGPEGGLSAAEIEMAQQAGFMPIRFGPRVMRTETAAVAALAVLQAQWGDFKD
jgi:16S rRNA (uracil1498-N3)-methyltransferase